VALLVSNTLTTRTRSRQSKKTSSGNWTMSGTNIYPSPCLRVRISTCAILMPSGHRSSRA